ncbi:MAG TPA: hypothetical protein VFN61_04395, partial [Acidimicrobiales bacterium]|nr:hypothetical protein [Acidimicrobiales bacterium]
MKRTWSVALGRLARPGKSAPGGRRHSWRMVAVATLCLAGSGAVAVGGALGVSGATAQAQGQGVSAGTQSGGGQACALTPSAAGCTLSSVALDLQSLTACTAGCTGYVVAVGATVELPIVATWSDGTSGPLDVLAGSTGPQVSVVSPPGPATALAPPAVVNEPGSNGSNGSIATLVTVALAPTTSPISLTVSFEGLSSAPIELGAVPGAATCGGPGQPACTPVNAALVQVSEPVLTGTAGVVPPGGFVAVSQAVDPAGGDVVTGAICYYQTPDGTAPGCGSAPTGLPAQASPSGCVLNSAGPCDVAAAWSTAASPDTLTYFPPAGWAVASASGCGGTVGPNPLAATCTLAPSAGSGIADVEFYIEPLPVLQVEAQGPPEPAVYCGSGPCPGLSPVYDDDVMNGVVATIGSASTGWAWCTLSGGVAGELGMDQPATCQMALVPGSYEVAIPTAVASGTGEVGVPYAYVNGPGTQTVTVPGAQAGVNASVSFTTAYEPQLEIEVTGPPVPCEYYFCDGLSPTVYDNASLDGDVLDVTPALPVGGSTGAAPQPGGGAQTCVLGGGTVGDGSTMGAPAYCQLYVPPGAYTVSLPATLATPTS